MSPGDRPRFESDRAAINAEAAQDMEAVANFLATKIIDTAFKAVRLNLLHDRETQDLYNVSGSPTDIEVKVHVESDGLSAPMSNDRPQETKAFVVGYSGEDDTPVMRVLVPVFGESVYTNEIDPEDRPDQVMVELMSASETLRFIISDRNGLGDICQYTSEYYEGEQLVLPGLRSKISQGDSVGEEFQKLSEIYSHLVELESITTTIITVDPDEPSINQQ